MAQDQAKIKLHWLNGSRAQGIVMMLEQLQVPYEIQVYHRDKNRLAPPELAKIHPLGKSPAVSITPSGGGQDIVLAETSFVVQYLSEHFGQGTLEPKKWKDGQEGKIGGETEEWMRYQYLLYYAEGSFMASLVQYYLFDTLRGPVVPFFIRPVTRMISNQVIGMLPGPALLKHFGLLESWLDKGPYLCGDRITGADFALAYAMVSLRSAKVNIPLPKATFQESYPKLWAYAERIEKEPAWQRGVEKIKSIEGDFKVLP